MAISMEELRQQFYENLKKADSSEAFEQLRIRYLGKKGEITGLLKNMGQLAADQRKEYGQKVNELKEKAEQAITERAMQAHVKELERRIALTPKFDLTQPVQLPEGSYHPITLVQRECEQIFASMGFTIEDYDEIVDDYHCF
ncbi:MAG: phenylalanine--tRNA ligase subunit alpha, partial [Clostridia bacterium]|nr:phenylalanine--tRNA ligase subunit alpha [Clostridia bacterium]